MYQNVQICRGWQGEAGAVGVLQEVVEALAEVTAGATIGAIHHEADIVEGTEVALEVTHHTRLGSLALGKCIG